MKNMLKKLILRKLVLASLTVWSGCFGVLLMMVMFVAVAAVAIQIIHSSSDLTQCGSANASGPEQMSDAPKSSPMMTGPSVLPAAYTVGLVSGPLGAKTAQNVALESGNAANSIPTNYVAYYKAAGAKYGIPWSVLAGVGKLETDHGRSKLPGVTSGENYAGAGGPMQFIPGTWKAYAVDGPEYDPKLPGDHMGKPDGKKSRYDPADAIPAAAKYLRALGAAANAKRALWTYNGSADSSWGYADNVLSWAKKYDQGLSLGPVNAPASSCAAGFGDSGGSAPGSVCPSGTDLDAEHMTRRMTCVRDQIKAQFRIPRGIGCYRPDGGIAGGGEHPRGRACDFMISSGSPEPDEVKRGYNIANWAKGNAKRLGIDYIIYRQHIWNPTRASEGWRPMEDRGGLTANHFDHVHISVLP
ncbi:lytic transglycosylase domain-containing protein [Actinomadura xylanilytica]|uniref:lytic transglycosylase domain-containing protein n=1 Tax=Actinomadura xylanilytica TaxID=887459 RepID=UPI00255B11C7|nr:lytic transglycosylase domain-containing protein [Actinomadura xylanilytica]MDL4772975.1 lytic transglycosylase domain-containing protein [Actinomadura xylanilytica]